MIGIEEKKQISNLYKKDEIDYYIKIIQNLLVINEPVIFTSDIYLDFQNGIMEYVIANNVDNTNEWEQIRNNIIYNSNEYLSATEANIILINLQKLKIEILQKNRDEMIFDENIHVLISKSSKLKYFGGYYADAVESAFKEVNSRCKKIMKNLKAKELDGANLMNELFSPNNPVLKFESLDNESGKNVQLGYMQIFSGSIIAIRNPKAHENMSLSKLEAYRRLCLASLLMEKIDDGVKYQNITE